MQGQALRQQGLQVGAGDRQRPQLLRADLLQLHLDRLHVFVELRVFQAQQQLTGFDLGAGLDQQLDQLARGLAVELAVLQGFDHARHTHMLGHRHAAQSACDQHQQAQADQRRAAAVLGQFRAHRQVAQQLEQRQDQGRESHEPGQRDAKVQVLLGDEQHDGRHQHQPVHDAEHAVQRQQQDLRAVARSGLGAGQGQDESLGQVLQLVARALVQVGHVDRVDQHVVAVEAHQGVEVEQRGRDAGRKDHVVGQRVDRTGRRVGPDAGGQRCHRQLGQHPREAHQQALAAAAKTPARGGVDIRQRREHQQHHAHRMHLAAEVFAHRRMAPLVDQLGDQEA